MHNADRSKTPHQSGAAHASLNEARTTGEGSEPSNQGDCPSDSPSLFSLLTFLPGRRGMDRAVLQGTSTRGLFIYCTLGIKTGGERRPVSGRANTALDDIAPSVDATPLRGERNSTGNSAAQCGGTAATATAQSRLTQGKASCEPSASSGSRGIPRD